MNNFMFISTVTSKKWTNSLKKKKQTIKTHPR